MTARVHEVDLEAKSAIVGLGAVESLVRLPLGWHAIDDGQRSLIFDAGGRMQINLSYRTLEGMELDELELRCFDSLVAEQPNVEVVTFDFEGVYAASVRDANFDGETLCQAFLIRASRRSDYALSARVTASSEDMPLAMNLAGDIVVNLQTLALANR